MKVIVTGATGYVGEGVLLECLNNPEIEKVLSVSRKPCGHVHPKLEEYLVPDFMKLETGDEKLMGYDARNRNETASRFESTDPDN